MLVLLQKKLPFRVVSVLIVFFGSGFYFLMCSQVNINLSKKPSWFLANTWGTVSVVRHRGAHVMESGVNSDYIDEVPPAYDPKNSIK